jgi:hypothetical protein
MLQHLAEHGRRCLAYTNGWYLGRFNNAYTRIETLPLYPILHHEGRQPTRCTTAYDDKTAGFLVIFIT